MAWSDKNWILDGATVHVSIVGFDGGLEKHRYLDGSPVGTINSDLTSAVDLVTARQLIENEHLSFQGVVLRGPFNISESHARRMIATSNSDATYLNSSVIKPRRTGEDIAQRSSNEYVVDFGLDTDIEIAKKYEAPFAYLAENVYPMRQKANQVAARERWWIHWNPRTEMRSAISLSLIHI